MATLTLGELKKKLEELSEDFDDEAEVFLEDQTGCVVDIRTVATMNDIFLVASNDFFFQPWD